MVYMNSPAYDDGFDTGYYALSDQNPYKVGTFDYDEWEAGFYDGEQKAYNATQDEDE